MSQNPIRESQKIQSRDVVTIDQITSELGDKYEIDQKYHYDSRMLPSCVNIYTEVINLETESRVCKMMNPNFPAPPSENHTISLKTKEELSYTMRTNWKDLLYPLGNISLDEKVNVFTRIGIVSPEESIKPRSDGFMITLNLGSDVIFIFRKKDTGQEYSVLVPRRSVLVIKDPYLEYEEWLDESKPLIYRPSPHLPSVTVKKGYRYILVWVVGSSPDKYVSYQATPTSSIFKPERLMIEVDTDGQVNLSREEVARYKELMKGEGALLQLLYDTPIQFPYMKYYMKKDPERQWSVLYKNLRSFDWRKRIDGRPYAIPELFNRNLDLFPLTFRGEPVTMVTLEEDFRKMDCITNYFTEYPRMMTVIGESSVDAAALTKKNPDTQALTASRLSPYKWWYSHFRRQLFSKLIAQGSPINTEILREGIYQMTREATLFKVSVAKAIIEMVLPEKKGSLRYLDMSAGWGDRMIAAAACDCKRYLGYDPNTLLIQGHEELIQSLYTLQTTDSKNQLLEVRVEPFERCRLPIREKFDLVFSSPPYFRYETYCEEATQSIKTYPDYENWVVYFLFVSIRKAWEALDVNGILALHIKDIPDMPRICDIVNLYIQARMGSSEYLGVISSQYRVEEEDDKTGKRRMPTWVWKKTSAFVVPKKSQEAEKRLKKYYHSIWSKMSGMKVKNEN